MVETILHTKAYGLKFQANQGFLINGKIVPSVASNNGTLQQCINMLKLTGELAQTGKLRAIIFIGLIRYKNLI